MEALDERGQTHLAKYARQGPDEARWIPGVRSFRLPARGDWEGALSGRRRRSAGSAQAGCSTPHAAAGHEGDGPGRAPSAYQAVPLPSGAWARPATKTMFFGLTGDVHAGPAAP